MLHGMTTCAYCHRPASTTIVAEPCHVCDEHALEFWTGLLVFAHGRAGCCVKDETWCDCPACAELDASRLRSLALRRVGPSPGDHVEFSMPLAS